MARIEMATVRGMPPPGFPAIGQWRHHNRSPRPGAARRRSRAGSSGLVLDHRDELAHGCAQQPGSGCLQRHEPGGEADGAVDSAGTSWRSPGEVSGSSTGSRRASEYRPEQSGAGRAVPGRSRASRRSAGPYIAMAAPGPARFRLNGLTGARLRGVLEERAAQSWEGAEMSISARSVRAAGRRNPVSRSSTSRSAGAPPGCSRRLLDPSLPGAEVVVGVDGRDVGLPGDGPHGWSLVPFSRTAAAPPVQDRGRVCSAREVQLKPATVVQCTSVGRWRGGPAGARRAGARGGSRPARAGPVRGSRGRRGSCGR